MTVDERARPLDRDDLDPDPLRQFERWYREAKDVVRAPEAMALATATRGGAPSLRMVLLKGFDERGFVFYTGYESRKGAELANNPRAALLFYWDPLGRQVRIEGRIERVAREQTEEYFHSRPRGAQLAALASRQSTVLGDRDDLLARYAQLESELEGHEVPLPGAWGGFRLEPETYEFWQHRENRLHDRFRYACADGNWIIERLSP
jgi:pyridoxamine 5'-phosphate oxidase